MASVTFTRHAITCDGCGAVFPADLDAAGLAEIRAAAYAAGWRFPPRVNAKSGRAAVRASDACPACIGTWKPQVAGQSPPRVLSASEAADFVRLLAESGGQVSP
jgi:hypothetical protein